MLQVDLPGIEMNDAGFSLCEWHKDLISDFLYLLSFELKTLAKNLSG